VCSSFSGDVTARGMRFMEKMEQGTCYQRA